MTASPLAPVTRPTPARTRRVAAALVVGVLAVSPTALASGAAGTTTVSSATAAVEHYWWYDALAIGEAHRVTTGKGVTVAVMDSGLSLLPAELKGTDIVFRDACRGPAEPSNADPASHGSGMVALIAGQGKQASPGGTPGTSGVAPDARVLFYSLDFIEAGFGTCKTKEEWYRDAVDRGASIISLSIGADANSGAEHGTRLARETGAVVVAAAGDRTSIVPTVDFPASFPGVVAVNALDRNARPWKDNPIVREPRNADILGRFPTISAPGVDVEQVTMVGGKSGVSPLSGTSPSTALVSGALALVKSRYPEATGNQLIQHLIHFTGGNRPYSWDRALGFGIVAVNKMLAHDPTGWPDENPLLVGPTEALRRYPMSVYRDPAASGSSVAAGPSAGSTPTREAKPTDPSAAKAPQAGGGTPTGLLWAGGAGLLVLAGVGALVVRTRRTTARDTTA